MSKLVDLFNFGSGESINEAMDVSENRMLDLQNVVTDAENESYEIIKKTSTLDSMSHLKHLVGAIDRWAPVSEQEKVLALITIGWRYGEFQASALEIMRQDQEALAEAAANMNWASDKMRKGNGDKPILN
jgi:hypothetical protein